MTTFSLSRITPPSLANILPRPRLLNLLKNHEHWKLILILGQAAQGKSTLAASFLKQSHAPAAWVNLGPEDSDPVNLFYSLVNAFQQALPEEDFSSLLDYPSRTMGPRDPIGLYREWIRGLAGCISIPIFLSLDGLDRLAADSLAFAFLQVLLDESPPELRLIMSSRQVPPDALNYQALKVKQQARVLNNEDLAFTRAEIRDFFSRTRKITLKPEQLDKVHRATEGWIGGLILLAEILGRDLDRDSDRFFRDSVLTRFRVEAFEYLGREIFDTQPPEVRDMLIRASLVPLVDPPLMRSLVGEMDAEGVLRSFAHRNLFVQGVYAQEKGWVFRFHQLFREFLLNRFQESFSEMEKTALYRKTASLFEDRGDQEMAVNLNLQAKDFHAAAKNIKQIGLDLFNQGRTEDLSKLLGALPETLIHQDPWLLLLFSLARRRQEIGPNIERLQRCLSLFEKSQDARGIAVSLSYLIEAFMVVGLDWDSLCVYLDKAKTWETDPQLEELPEWKAFLLLQVGYNLTLRGNLYQGYQTLQKALLPARILKNPALQAIILSHLLANLTLRGEIDLAKEVSDSLENLIEGLQYLETKTWYSMSMSLYYVIRGDREKTLEMIDEVKKIISENGFLYLYMPSLLYEAAYQALLGDPETAKAKGMECAGIAASVGSFLYEGISHFWMGIALYRSHNFEEAREHLWITIRISSSGKGYSEMYNQAAEILLVLCEQGLKDRKQAIGKLEEILNYFKAAKSYLFQCYAHLALALTHWDLGEKDQAGKHLTAGFLIARDKGHKPLVGLNPLDCVRACLLAFELEIPEAYELARELLTAYYAEAAEPELEKLAQHPQPRMRSLGQELLRAIHRQKVPFLDMKTFGGLEITRGEASMGEEAWDRLQPKRLLMALLSHPGGKASKEALMDDLWPGEVSDKSENNFKVTLLRLRKALEPNVHPVFSSSYIHLHNNLVYLDPELTRIDTEVFLKSVGRGSRRQQAGDGKGAKEEYEKALACYQGDFLPLENSLPGVDRRRDELKKIFVDTLLRLARLAEEQGTLKKAAAYCRRILETDPLHEEACRNYMQLCLMTANYNDALKAFGTLEKNLQKELKSPPDPRTLDLYNQVRTRSAR